MATVNPGLTWIPPIPCSCGERHRLGSRYYVSIVRDPALGPKSQTILALGPYLTHQEALANVDRVRRYVHVAYANDPHTPWYGYGTVAMAYDYTTPGKLTGVIQEFEIARFTIPAQAPRPTRRRKAA